MQIISRKIEDIKPYDRNAKKHPKEQVKKVADSIREFGFAQPVVVDKDGVLIVGHGRLDAAKLLGLKEVPSITVDLTKEQADAYRLADNKLNESEWDMKLVVEELKGLSAEMLDLTGFDKDLIIEPDDKDDTIPEVPNQAVSQIGDLYELGNHRLLCGDSTNLQDVERLMNGARADCVFTDPPYALFGNSTGVAGITDDKMTRPFFLEIFRALQRNTKLFAHIYTCCDWHSAFSLQAMAKECGLTEKNLCIWDKGDGGVGAMYQQCYEMVWFHANSPIATKTMGKGKAGEKTVQGKPNIWRFKRANKDRVHNAQKPTDLVAFALQNSSDENDLVLDLFLGGGTTLIASEKTGRICYGMELDPKYIDVIVERYCEYTGNRNIIKNGENIIWQKQTQSEDQQ